MSLNSSRHAFGIYMTAISEHELQRLFLITTCTSRTLRLVARRLLLNKYAVVERAITQLNSLIHVNNKSCYPLGVEDHMCLAGLGILVVTSPHRVDICKLPVNAAGLYHGSPAR